MFVSHDAYAKCIAGPAKTMAAEADRIGDCLGQVAVQPRGEPDASSKDRARLYSERLLYTWGPKVKIARMVEDPYFCDYEFARQNEFEYRKYLSYELPEYFWGGSPGFGTMTEIDARYKAIRAAPKDFPDESADKLRGLSVQFALGPLHNVGGSAKERRTLLSQAATKHADSAFSLEKAQADGRFAAHNMANESRTSSIKGGFGVYFSADPFRFFTPGDEGREFGLVCRTPKQPVMIDRSDQKTADTLVQYNITYRDSQITIDGSTLVPTIENPALMDRAARKRFILHLPMTLTGGMAERESVYVDKCSLPYDNPGVCQPISLESEWLSCHDFKRVVGLTKSSKNGQFSVIEVMTNANPDGRVGAVLLKYFLSRSHGKLLRERFQECYGEVYSPEKHGERLPKENAAFRDKLNQG